ncbi:hypothetical protein Psch_02640 [Pelotomaculum schinkii]|uniref:Uncharacterized protein n=1 Tax=Pelotomaculum schinkii TaxID=78350 RepID=A0A4Y7RA66_9FIRM|nr:hypothetical protein Psch_02640 [Pelotomaculum schinkii]
MTQQRAQRADFGPSWPEVAGFGEAPQQAVFRDCGHSHIACRFAQFHKMMNIPGHLFDYFVGLIG